MLNALALAVLLPLVAARAADDEASHVKAELLAEQTAVQPGGKITLGVRLRMSDGWHIYWRNPGDSGLATTVKWTLPPGFKAGEPQWPYPKRFADKHSTTFGYDDEAVLLTNVSVPARIAAGPITLAANVEWLECKSICVPGEARLSVELPAHARGASAGANFAVAREKIPKKSGIRAEARRVKEGIALTFAGPVDPEGGFFPSDNNVVDNTAPAGGTACGTGDCFTYFLRLSKAPGAAAARRLDGIIVASGARRAFAVSIPIKAESSRGKK